MGVQLGVQGLTEFTTSMGYYRLLARAPPPEAEGPPCAKPKTAGRPPACGRWSCRGAGARSTMNALAGSERQSYTSLI